MSAFVAQALREAEHRRATAPTAQPHALDGLSVDQLAEAASAGDVEAVGRLYDTLVLPDLSVRGRRACTGAKMPKT